MNELIDIEVVTNQHAFKSGELGYLIGLDIDSNPLLCDKELAKDWELGYLHAVTYAIDFISGCN